MKEQHRIAARVAARVKTGHLELPRGVTSVAARLGPPVTKDRVTGRVAYLYTEETPHESFSGRCVVGKALSPVRPAPRVSGAVPRRRKGPQLLPECEEVTEQPACRACGRTDKPCTASCPYADQLRVETKRPVKVQSEPQQAPASSESKPGQ